MTPDEIRTAAEKVARSALGDLDLLDVTESIPAAATDDDVEQILDLAKTATLTIPAATEPTPARAALDLPLPDNDAKASTIRDYLCALLTQVWEHGEGFSAKRPFGNSGWADDLYAPLIRAGLVAGQLDEDGYIENLDQAAADQLIADAIQELAGPTPTPTVDDGDGEEPAGCGCGTAGCPRCTYA